ncbi:cytochrome-c oxidase, cbb3-type subunit III [Inquilinus sp. OTU3971]|uniref:cytochrome-c oxidase, cbb3-type subunit III n=1 Tax=Inquilinus sp. OTU3971 TaxID=3043855 RepID=UPI00313BA6D8
MPTKIEKDAVTGQETTGHEWDGIKELNTPLPRWWLYVLYATIAFSAVWMVFYPSVPLGTSYFKGVLDYSQRQELARDVAAATAVRAPMVDRIRSLPLDQVQADPELATFALTGGKALFAENCSACHAAGGAGRAGFPALVDDDWIWGGSLAQLEQTISYGVRSGHARAHAIDMPRFGVDGMLSQAEIGDVADYALTLSGRGSGAPGAAKGGDLFAQNCAACHGDRGQGNPEMGAPRLDDQVWLYGDTRADIIRQIAQPRQGVMPSWSGRLDDAAIKMLTLYVHSLGGGQ